MSKFWVNPFNKFKEKLIEETRIKKELDDVEKKKINRINSSIAYEPKYTNQSTLVDDSIFYDELNHRMAVNNGSIKDYIKSKENEDNQRYKDSDLESDEELLKHLQELYKDYVDTDNK